MTTISIDGEPPREGLSHLEVGDAFLRRTGIRRVALRGGRPDLPRTEVPELAVSRVTATGPGWADGVDAEGAVLRYAWGPRSAHLLGSQAAALGPAGEVRAFGDGLPEGTDAQIVAYATPALTPGSSPVLARLERRLEDGSWEASVVCERRRVEAELIETGLFVAGMDAAGALSGTQWIEGFDPPPDRARGAWILEGSAAIRRRRVALDLAEGAVEAPRPGLLLSAFGVSCEVDAAGATTATLAAPSAVGVFDDAALGAFMPSRARPWSERGHDIGGFEDEEERAVARGEPSEALVVASGEGHHPKAMLSSSGIAFHRVDDAVDLIGDPPGKGVWIYAGARIWSYRDEFEGDYDCGIDGDWVPAEAADLARHGIDADALDLEIASAFDLDPEHGIGARWMAEAAAR